MQIMEIITGLMSKHLIIEVIKII
ncbi:uncharacterized protein METZ01_LOCUS360538 [marine metagenome]|uniref:Uncharacterized protein n=1 Tax=marine metagenome TaxID=408172 RepID=A0A382SCQ3_9ZZZZ